MNISQKLKTMLFLTVFFFSNSFSQIGDPLEDLIGQGIDIYCLGSVSCFACQSVSGGLRQTIESTCEFIGFFDESICDSDVDAFDAYCLSNLGPGPY